MDPTDRQVLAEYDKNKVTTEITDYGEDYGTTVTPRITVTPHFTVDYGDTSLYCGDYGDTSLYYVCELSRTSLPGAEVVRSTPQLRQGRKDLQLRH